MEIAVNVLQNLIIDFYKPVYQILKIVIIQPSVCHEVEFTGLRTSVGGAQ